MSLVSRSRLVMKTADTLKDHGFISLMVSIIFLILQEQLIISAMQKEIILQDHLLIRDVLWSL